MIDYEVDVSVQALHLLVYVFLQKGIEAYGRLGGAFSGAAIGIATTCHPAFSRDAHSSTV